MKYLAIFVAIIVCACSDTYNVIQAAPQDDNPSVADKLCTYAYAPDAPLEITSDSTYKIGEDEYTIPFIWQKFGTYYTNRAQTLEQLLSCYQSSMIIKDTVLTEKSEQSHILELCPASAISADNAKDYILPKAITFTLQNRYCHDAQ